MATWADRAVKVILLVMILAIAIPLAITLWQHV